MFQSILGIFFFLTVALAQQPADLIEDPVLFGAYCEQRFGKLESSELESLAIEVLTNQPATQGPVDEKALAQMCSELIFLAGIYSSDSANTDEHISYNGGADCGASLVVEYSGPLNGEIRSLANDVGQVVAFLQEDRREARGRRTQGEVFRLADSLLDQQLKVFNEINALSPSADRNDKFLVRTIKDVDMNENEFKRRSFVMKNILDLVILGYERTGRWVEPEKRDLEKRLKEAGFNPRGGDLGDAINALRNIKEKMDEGWNIGNAMPPAGASSSLANQIAKLKNIRLTAFDALDDNKTLKADDFYYYSYFIASRRQQTTTFVQPNKDGKYLPFKESRSIMGIRPSLSQAMGSKLVQGDVKQPEGFLEASWGAASANVLNGYGQWMYYRSHVNYGSDVSEPERAKLRNQLRQSGLRGNKGGDIRIHADVGSIGCLELPIEDSVAVTGLTKRGNNPQMQTIPFPFTPENLEYFGNKIEGHGEFWKKIAKEEASRFEYAPATPVNEVLDSVRKESRGF